VFGALTFEKSKKKKFSEQDVQLCETAAHMVGPILHIKRKEDRWILTKVLLSLKKFLGKFVGPRHLGWKLGLIILELSSVSLWPRRMDIYRMHL
jgi:hypothetical protein